MKKGFTLIELLGVIAILGLIVAVAVPSLIESNNQAKLNEEKDFENTLKLVTRDYINYYGDEDICAEDNTECITKANELSGIYVLDTEAGEESKSIQVTTDELINVNFLKKSLVDPKTNKKLENEKITITVTNTEGTISYSYTRPE